MALTTSPRRGVASPVPEGPLLPILTDERAERPVLGLWYPRQQGTIKAGDGRFYSPFVVGKAQICQNRDQLKLVFEELTVVRRSVSSKGNEARQEESEEDKNRRGDALNKELELMTDAEKTVRLAEVKAKESADMKQKADAAYEDAVNMNKMHRFNTRIKLCVYLTRKTPKARMVDIEEAGVILMFDKGGDKFDGCLYTDNQGEATWPYLEQGLLKIDDPYSLKGVCLVKRSKDPPQTSEPVMYGYARLDPVPDRLRPSDSVLGMQEIKDLLAKSAAPKASVAAAAKGVVSFFGKALGIVSDEPPVDVSKLKANGFYVRQADSIWQYLKKSEEDHMSFDEFKGALDHLEFYMLEPRAQRLFAACDLAKTGKITIIDFQMGLMMNDVIPAEQGLMPLDAFTLFDYKGEGEINQAQFREIANALGLQADDEKFEELWKKADEDGSGMISYAEFKNIFVKLVKVDDEFKKRGLEVGLLSSEEKQQERLKRVLDDEEAQMLRAFASARVLIEEQLTKRRIERDEKKRILKEEQVKLKRLEKLTAAFKRKQKSETEKKVARERAKSKIEQRQMKAKLEQEEKDLKAKKDEEIKRLRKKKEEDRLAEVRAKHLDRWDLRHNGFKEVPSWVYVGKEAENRLDVLVLLDLSENKLDTLPDDGFLYWMNSLRELNLAHNLLTSIPREVRNCAKLELLNLSNNRLRSLPSELGVLVELRQLDVFKNHLEALPAEIGNLTKLRVLNVHSNRIFELPTEVQELQELQRLDVGDNQLRYLPDDLSKLGMTCTDLDVSANLLNYLPHALGDHLFNLKFLEVSFNQLGDLPMSLSRLGSLLTLRMRENEVRELDSVLVGLTSLMELDACYNELDLLGPGVGKCTALQSLKLNRNKLRSLPPQIGELEHLQLLNVQFNPLGALVPGVGTLISLQTLSLCHSQLAGPLPDGFAQMAGLRHVDLSHNDVTGLPEAMGDLKRLKTLNLSRNRIAHLPESMRVCEQLEHLDLSSNRLTRFPGFIVDMPRLTHLDLSSNAIAYLPQDVHTLGKHLRFLGLEHNRLRTVPTDFWQLATKINVSLSKNPWHELPKKWNVKWTPKEQTESPWGYSTWDVVDWASLEHRYYPACCEEWAESGALHCTGRASLQDFIQGVEKRMGGKWFKGYTFGVTRIYFQAREHGVMPRMYQLPAEEDERIKARVEASQARRQDQIGLVRRLHHEHSEKLRALYEETPEHMQLVRSRYLTAVSKFETRMEVKRRERQAERRDLMAVVTERKAAQEQRARLKEEADMALVEEEMARLLQHARKTPFY